MIKIPYTEAETTFNKLLDEKIKCIVLFTG
jgi:hypothetical protein